MNYKQVIQDYNNGTINKNEWTLVMDNDSGYWDWSPSNLSDAEIDQLYDQKIKEMETKYGTPDGYRDIVDILTAAGVTCDWC